MGSRGLQDMYVVVIKYYDGDPDDVFGTWPTDEEAEAWTNTLPVAQPYYLDIQKILAPSSGADILEAHQRQGDVIDEELPPLKGLLDEALDYMDDEDECGPNSPTVLFAPGWQRLNKGTSVKEEGHKCE